MRQIIESTESFQACTADVLNQMFGLSDVQCLPVDEAQAIVTTKTFVVTIHYTGTVYGEYMLAMDPATAAAIIGIDSSAGIDAESIKDDISDAISETLNTIVGQSIGQLQATYAKLTLTAPRVFFGQFRYPKFRTGRGVIKTSVGDIECHFCLDLMRLDLATSYEEAVDSLVQVNGKLKDANRHLAEQQTQLVQSEKMASLGMLASGVAHEINSPLFFVDSNLNTLGDYMQIIESVVDLYEQLGASAASSASDLLEEAFVESMAEVQRRREQQDFEFVMQDTRHLVDETRQGVQRIKGIVNGLKEFSAVDRDGVVEADLNVITENALALIACQLSGQCQIVKEFSTLPPVPCNVGEIGQVLVNVIVNAGQAICGDAVESKNANADENRGGRIHLQTFVEDDNVVLRVSDNGNGISEDVLKRIFDPFFTTKPVGKGAGLGLSISYGIIRKHHGSIDVKSVPGCGTTVQIRLPLAGVAERLQV